MNHKIVFSMLSSYAVVALTFFTSCSEPQKFQGDDAKQRVARTDDGTDTSNDFVRAQPPVHVAGVNLTFDCKVADQQISPDTRRDFECSYFEDGKAFLQPVTVDKVLAVASDGSRQSLPYSTRFQYTRGTLVDVQVANSILPVVRDILSVHRLNSDDSSDDEEQSEYRVSNIDRNLGGATPGPAIAETPTSIPQGTPQPLNLSTHEKKDIRSGQATCSPGKAMLLFSSALMSDINSIIMDISATKHAAITCVAPPGDATVGDHKTTWTDHCDDGEVVVGLRRELFNTSTTFRCAPVTKAEVGAEIVGGYVLYTAAASMWAQPVLPLPNISLEPWIRTGGFTTVASPYANDLEQIDICPKDHVVTGWKQLKPSGTVATCAQFYQ